MFVEGGVYCPATPIELLNASIRLQENEIDTETFRLRLKERNAYKVHQKEREDSKGQVVFRCPAIGPSATVRCPIRDLIDERNARLRAEKIREKKLKELDSSSASEDEKARILGDYDKETAREAEERGQDLIERDGRRILPEIDDGDYPEDMWDKICQQHSVKFTSSAYRRQKQAFDYGTDEWQKFHTHARNSIESLNAQVKAGGTEDIETASRRRVRGFAAAQIFVTILLANFNMRKIAAFMSDKIKEDAKRDAFGEPPVARKRGRDSRWHNPYTGTYPEGVTRPGKPKPKSDSDGTGGPPLRT